MLELNLIKKILQTKQYAFFFLLVSVFLLPISINFSSFFIYLSIFSKVAQIVFLKDKLFASKALKGSSLIGLVFFVYIVLDLFFQSDYKIDPLFFNREFSKLALLVLVPMLLVDGKDVELLYKSLLLGVIIATVFAAFYSVFNGLPFSRRAFEEGLDLHHTYLGVILLFLLNKFMLIIQSLKDLTKTDKVIIPILAVLFLGIIFVINSKVSMLVFLVLFLFYFIAKLSRKNVVKYFSGLMVVSLLFLFFNQKANVNYQKAMDFRIQIWDASLRIANNNLFFGDLTQREKDVLNKQHFLDGKYYFMDSDLNTHNQYLSFLMRFGIIGALLFSGLAIYAVKIINICKERKLKQEFFGFAIILLLVFYIENILSRHHGIVFFTVFYNYYLIKLSNETT